MGAENFATLGALFVATSVVSSGVQKKEYSGSSFGGKDVGDAVTFVGETISFKFSALGIQKKESSETSFEHGVTGDETSFVRGAIRSDSTS